MADKEAIERGMRLSRLLNNEDYWEVLKEWESRLTRHRELLNVNASSVNGSPVIIDRLINRINELEDFKQWIHDEIEAGGREKIKQDILEAKDSQ